MEKKRILVLAICLTVSYLVVNWVQSSNETTIAPPKFALDEIPMQLGEWTGKDTPIQDDIVDILAAQSFINRVYRNPAGQRIDLHIARWVDVNGSVTPHHPTVCYPAAGWNIVAREKTTFSYPSGEAPIELIEFEKNGQHVVSGHWFQAGDSRYTSAESLLERWQIHINRVDDFEKVKVMLQSNLPSMDTAEPQLAEFAALVVDAMETIRENR